MLHKRSLDQNLLITNILSLIHWIKRKSFSENAIVSLTAVRLNTTNYTFSHNTMPNCDQGIVRVNEMEFLWFGEAGAVPQRMDASAERLMSLWESISLSSFLPGNLIAQEKMIMSSSLAEGNTVNIIRRHFR